MDEHAAQTTEPQPVTEEPKRPQLKTLSSVEQVVNDYARRKAKEWKMGIKDDEFVVLLARKFGGIMGLRRGRPVQIILLWPDAQTSINSLLKDAFETIRKHKMVDCWAIEPAVAIRARKTESRRWRKEKFGDEAEIIGELIPRRQIIVDTVSVTTVRMVIRDQYSGVQITKEISDKRSEHHDGRDLDIKTWLEISRLARDAEPIDAYEDEAEAPELEQALAATSNENEG